MRKRACELISGTPRREYALRMRTVPLSAIALLLALAAAPAAAETYKWVDAKGVVTYSDTPPPSTAAKPQVVAERVSVMPPDPMFTAAAAALEARLARRAQYEEADYALRQRYMLEAQLTQMNYAAAADAYAEAAYAAYYGYGGWGYVGNARRFGPKVTHYRAPIRPYNSLPSYSDLPSYGAPRAGARAGAPAGRGSFR
jgi:hypothetical protein